MTEISAYIPCYNNVDTIRQSIESIQAQSQAVAELFVVDDGSQDGSSKIAEDLAVPVIRLPQRSGRGAARARAMEEARHELVLCLDGSKVLPASFLADALGRFENEQVAAVFGRITQPPPATVVDRWSGRHLLKEGSGERENRKGLLITAGALVRRSAVMQAGNYNAALTYAEDRDLGERLLALGFDVLFDPKLQVTSLVHADLSGVMERYWRWQATADGKISWSAYLRQVIFSIKVMAVQDLRAGDPMGIPISLLSPHWQLWKSVELALRH